MRYFSKCPKCSYPVKENQKFCTKCGLNLESEFRKVYPADFISEFLDIYAKIDLEKNNDELYSQLGDLFLSINKPSEAIPYYEKALELNDKNLKTILNCAGAYFKIGDISHSEFLLRKALVIDPNSIQANEILFYIYSKDKTNYNEAIKIAEKILNYKSNDINFLIKLKDLYLFQQDYQKSKEFINFILSQKQKLNINDENFNSLLKNLVYINIKLENYEEAYQLSEQISDKDEDLSLMTYKTFIYSIKNEFEISASYLTRLEPKLAFISNPDLVNMLCLSAIKISKFYLERGNFNLAEKFAKFATSISKTDDSKKLLAEIILHKAIEKFNSSKALPALKLLINAQTIYPKIKYEKIDTIKKIYSKVKKQAITYLMILTIYIIALIIILYDFSIWQNLKDINNKFNIIQNYSSILITDDIISNSTLYINSEKFSNENFQTAKLQTSTLIYLPPGSYNFEIKPNSSNYLDTSFKLNLQPGKTVYVDFKFKEKPSYLGVIIGTNVILRAEPTTLSPIIARLNNGDVVTIIDKLTSENLKEAITSKETFLITDFTRVPLSKGKAILVISERGDYVEVETDYQGRKLRGLIHTNDIERIFYQTWYKVKTNSDKIGWIFGKFLMEHR
jgi:tetratricopeptide (TPR) repeat protein